MKCILLLLLVATQMCVASVWRDDLWLGRGSFWSSRVGVSITNPTERDWEGESVAIPVGTDPGQIPLGGTRIEALRLVDARGVQLEYGVWDKHETTLLRTGTVPADGVVMIPVVCPAKGTATFEIYFDNPQAWGLADFWTRRTRTFVNGDFEDGAPTPTGWQTSGTDAAHQMSVVEGGCSGKKCIQAVAEAGAPESWFSYSQSGIPVTPGQELTIRVQIRGVDIKGYAGWYVHAGNEKKSDILNRVFQVGSGTFPWKPFEMTVKIPTNCVRMTIGSVLRGTGTAWFDDVKIEGKAEPVAPVVKVAPIEKLACREIGLNAAWSSDASWQYRVPIRLANFGTTDVPSALASFALPEALHATRNPVYELTLNGQKIESTVLGNRILFSCSLPAKSVTTCYLYVKSGPSTGIAQPVEVLKSALGSEIPSDQVLVKSVQVTGEEAFAKLLNSSANLVKNPSFEDGEKDWRHETRKGLSFEIAEGGRFGGKFAKFTIPTGVKPNWSGWRQTVRVQPEHTYFYGCFISGDNLETAASVHAHLLTEKGALVPGGMSSAGRGVNGTAPWTPVFGTFYATAETRQVNLQLTMNGCGTVAHDGVLVADYRMGKVGDPEFAPSKADDASLRVGQIDPVVKVFREMPVTEKPGKAFTISMARNETEPLQLVVRSGCEIKDLEVVVEPPARVGGVFEKKSAPLAVTVGRVDYVPVDWPTAYYSCTTPEWVLRYPHGGGQSDGWSGWWPDPIVSTNRGAVQANASQAWWINVKTLPTTKPGFYQGRIAWKVDGSTVRTDVYTVKVWDFCLPSRPSFPAIYDLRIGGLWKGLGATQEERREKLWAFMAEKKLCPDTLGGTVKFAKDKDGRVTADFTEYDRLAERYFDYYKFPESYTPNVFYCFGWAMPPKKFLGEDPYEGAWPYEGADWTKLRPQYKRVYQQALKLYWDHVKAKGWADKLTLYISDEPHFSRTNIVEQMKACCAMIHEVDPGIRIYSSTWRHCPEWNDSLDVWGVGHYGCFPVDEMAARAKAGKRIWWTTDGQMCTDTPYCAVERMLPLYAHKYHADAYEFWGSTWLTYDPWKFGWHAYIRQSDTPGKTYWVRYPAGDGYLIYPPRDGETEPVTTIRLEAARDGVEDFAYFQLLEKRAKTDPKAAALLSEYHSLVTIPNAGGRFSSRILPEPERLGQLRLRAGELLNGR